MIVDSAGCDERLLTVLVVTSSCWQGCRRRYKNTVKEREKCGLEARRGPREANGQQLPITSIIAITAEQLNSQPKTASLHKHSHTRLLPVKSAITCHWGKNVKGMETWAGTREDGERGMGIVGGDGGGGVQRGGR